MKKAIYGLFNLFFILRMNLVKYKKEKKIEIEENYTFET